MKKRLILFLAVCLLSVCSSAWGENLHLYTSHNSVTGLTDGHSDYSNAKFLRLEVNALDFSVQTNLEDAQLKGSMTFSGGNYSCLDADKVMQKISGKPYAFQARSLYGIGRGLQYGPVTSSGDFISLYLKADGGMNSVNVSWNFPKKPSYNGYGTIPNYRTTSQQVASLVPYVEYIRNGSQVTGLKWRVVNPSNTSTPAPQTFGMFFQVNGVASAESFANDWWLWTGPWDGTGRTYIAPGNIPEGTVTFDSPINESEIFLIMATLSTENGDESGGDYKWYFSKGPIASITTASLPAGTVGKSYNATLTSSPAVATWALSSGTLPDGLKLTASTGKISGTPTKAGSYTFTVKATNTYGHASGATVTKKFTVKVTQTTVTATIPATIVRGVSYTWKPKASAGTSGYTWSISSGKLPTGMKINASTGKITGTPTKAGTFKFTVKATDKNNIAATKAFTVKVTQTTITATIPSTIVKGVSYTWTPKATGGTSAYKWSKSSGTLPTGMKINASTGKITGKPTKAGTFKFTIKAVDKNKIAGTKTFTVKVLSVELEEIISSIGLKNYQFKGYVLASNGTAPYTWSISSGKLPTGLKLTSSSTKATIKGTPTKTGTFTFTVKAVDKNKASATVKITVLVIDISSLAGTAGKSAQTAEPSSSKTTEQKSSSSSKSSLHTAPLDLSTGSNTDVNIRATLSVASDDVVESYEGKDSDMVKVKADKPLTFIIGKWPEEVESVTVYVDDKAVDGVKVTEGVFTLPPELVHNDFKVSVKSGKQESEELFIIAE